MNIRPATLADIPAMVRLEEISFPGDRLSARALRRLVQGGRAMCLVAEMDGRLAGDAIALTRKGSPSLRLYSVAVHPGFRQAGIGTALLDASEQWAIRTSHDEIRLEVREDNDAAIRRYLAVGYVVTGRKADFYDDGAAATVMKKRLGDLSA